MKIPAYAVDGSAYFRSHLTAGASGAKSEKSGDAAQSTRLHGLREALDRLKAVPNIKQTAKEAAASKVGFLQRRLQMLKQLLLHASPEQAKALARELKNIAGELAAVARAAGGSGGQSSMPTPAALNAATGNQAENEAAAQAQEASASADRDAVPPDASQAPKPEANGTQQPAAPAPAGKEDGQGPESEGSGDGGLKGALQEARKLLREAIELMKSKLAATGRKAREDLQEAEKSLSDLSRSLDTGVTAPLYTSLGSSTGAADGVGGAMASGSNISVAA